LSKFLSQVLRLLTSEQLIAILPDPDTLNIIERCRRLGGSTATRHRMSSGRKK
jgi:hypothetical protein